MRRKFTLPLLVAAGMALGAATQEVSMDAVIPAAHPRLLVKAENTGRFRQNAATPYGKLLAERILYDADQLLAQVPQKREMIGRRLLMASRTVLYRINTLGVAWQLTGNAAYAERAVLEMEYAAAYSDWNPAHYLDVGEMTLALAIGYDWLYDLLTPAQRESIARAIIEKGIKPSYQGKHWWINGGNNWNPVCHAGLIAGAIAVAELEPELAKKTVERAVKGVPRSMKPSYSPEGAYPEGPMYWSYGSEFNTCLIALLENAFGSDFGLCGMPGFQRTGDYIQAVTAPSGYWFNYADCSPKRGSSFAMIYLAARFDRPDWFDAAERKLLRQYASARPKRYQDHYNRMLPLALLYLDLPEQETPGPLAYYSGAKSLIPIAIHRSGHGAKDAWLGVKGGYPAGPHGHMDGGSFVYESQGCRWAIDLGMENYTKIEATPMNLWTPAQNADRWKLLRLGPASHNILRIDGAEQNVKGDARITRFSETESAVNLTPLYEPAVKQAARTLSLLPGRGMKCKDALTGLRPGAEVTWQFCTPAEAEIRDGKLILRHGKQEMPVLKNAGGAWTIVPDSELRNEYDTPNPGVKMVSFTLLAPEDGTLEFEVIFGE